ncbi:MAG TPA: hypothetical protein VFF69_08375 [Phycisphaerales bacterium]|nr:hypothetical protein [Phycisphaerales bacterium]
MGDPAFARAAHRAYRAHLAGGGKAAWFAGMLLVVVGINATNLLLQRDLPVWLLAAGWLGVSFLVSSVAQALTRRRAAARTADALLAEAICPTCLYNMASQQPHEGLLDCPECGSRWRAARIARRHEFNTGSPGRARKRRSAGEAGDMSGPTHVLDDRREPRPIVHGRLRESIRCAEGELRDRLITARDEIVRHGRGRRMLLAGLAGLLFLQNALFMLVIFPRLTPNDGVRMSLGLLSVVLAVFIPRKILRGAGGIKAAHIRDAMLRQSLCPSCAMELPLEHSMEAELVTCGDCGAAWNNRPSRRAGQVNVGAG